MVLYSKKSPQDSINDFSDESKDEALIVKCNVSRNDKKTSRLKRIQSRIDSTASEGYDTGKKISQ